MATNTPSSAFAGGINKPLPQSTFLPEDSVNGPSPRRVPRFRHSASASMSSHESTASEETSPISDAPASGQRRGQRMQSFLAPKMKIHGPAPWDDLDGEVRDEDIVHDTRRNSSPARSPRTDKVLPKAPKKGLNVKGLDLTKNLMKRATSPLDSSAPSPSKFKPPPLPETLPPESRSNQSLSPLLPMSEQKLSPDTDRTPTMDSGPWPFDDNGQISPNINSAPFPRSVSARPPTTVPKSPVLREGVSPRSASCGTKIPASSYERLPHFSPSRPSASSSLDSGQRPFTSSESSTSLTSGASTPILSQTQMQPPQQMSGHDASQRPMRLISLEAAQAKERERQSRTSSESGFSHVGQYSAQHKQLKTRKSGFLKMFANRKEDGHSPPPSLPSPTPSSSENTFSTQQQQARNGHLHQDTPQSAPPISVSSDQPAGSTGLPKKRATPPRSAPPTQVKFMPAPPISQSDRIHSNGLGVPAPSLALRPVSMAFSDNFSSEMLLRMAQDEGHGHHKKGEPRQTQTPGTDREKVAWLEPPLSSPASITTRSASSTHSGSSIFERAQGQFERDGSWVSNTPTTPGFTPSGNEAADTPSDREKALKTQVWELEEVVRKLEMELDSIRHERDAALAKGCSKVSSFIAPIHGYYADIVCVRRTAKSATRTFLKPPILRSHPSSLDLATSHRIRAVAQHYSAGKSNILTISFCHILADKSKNINAYPCLLG